MIIIVKKWEKTGRRAVRGRDLIIVPADGPRNHRHDKHTFHADVATNNQFEARYGKFRQKLHNSFVSFISRRLWSNLTSL